MGPASVWHFGWAPRTIKTGRSDNQRHQKIASRSQISSQKYTTMSDNWGLTLLMICLADDEDPPQKPPVWHVSLQNSHPTAESSLKRWQNPKSEKNVCRHARLLHKHHACMKLHTCICISTMNKCANRCTWYTSFPYH